MVDLLPTVRPSPPKLAPVRLPIPEETVEARSRDFREILHGYSREEAVLETKRCVQCRRPWCVEACPITQDGREYIRLISAEDFDGAARVTLRDNPLATSLCKVCYHYCEDACVVKRKGVPVAIRQLKRAALELGRSDLAYIPSKPKGQRVAVVGAGPAGLTAAWDLAVRGYGVTVYEQETRFGGLMQTIPAYRLTDREVETDRARFRDLDVTFVDGTRVGREVPFERLLGEGYAAVLLTLGTPLPHSLGIPGEELPGVLPALPFLRDLNAGRRPEIGPRVVVVGGGDVAMDSVRSARRLVSPQGVLTVVYRRGREEMPADPEEVHGAEEEGIQFQFLRAPVRIVGRDHVEGLVVQAEQLGPPGLDGRRRPIPVEGSESTIPCDTVISAVGQRADLAGLPSELDLAINARGWPEGKAPGFATGMPGVFATGGRSVVYAMGSAIEAVEAIDRFLAAKRGEVPTPRPDALGGSGTFHPPPGYTQPIRI